MVKLLLIGIVPSSYLCKWNKWIVKKKKMEDKRKEHNVFTSIDYGSLFFYFVFFSLSWFFSIFIFFFVASLYTCDAFTIVAILLLFIIPCVNFVSMFKKKKEERIVYKSTLNHIRASPFTRYRFHSRHHWLTCFIFFFSFSFLYLVFLRISHSQFRRRCWCGILVSFFYYFLFCCCSCGSTHRR